MVEKLVEELDFAADAAMEEVAKPSVAEAQNFAVEEVVVRQSSSVAAQKMQTVVVASFAAENFGYFAAYLPLSNTRSVREHRRIPSYSEQTRSLEEVVAPRILVFLLHHMDRTR